MSEPEPRAPLKTFDQKTRNDSPWSVRQRIAMLAWEYCWLLFCVWTPKPFNPWRLAWLRLFGAKIHGDPFVHQRARIQIPWNVTLHDRSCLGDRANLYSLAEIEIGARAVIAQEAYLCTGTHEFENPAFPLRIGDIRIGEEAFVGARAFVLPGTTIGRRVAIGSCAVVTHDVPDDAIVAGNPAKILRTRTGPAT